MPNKSRVRKDCPAKPLKIQGKSRKPRCLNHQERSLPPLLEHGTWTGATPVKEPGIKDGLYTGYTPIQMMVFDSRPEIVLAGLDITDAEMATLQHLAASAGKPVTALLRAGLDYALNSPSMDDAPQFFVTKTIAFARSLPLSEAIVYLRGLLQTVPAEALPELRSIYVNLSESDKRLEPRTRRPIC